MSYDLATLQQLIGYSIQMAFGNMYLAGAVLILVIAVALYRAGVPADASVAIAIPIMLAMAGAFLPQWITGFLLVALGMLAGLAFYKFFMR